MNVGELKEKLRGIPNETIVAIKETKFISVQELDFVGFEQKVDCFDTEGWSYSQKSVDAIVFEIPKDAKI